MAKVVDDVILDNYWDHNLPIPSIEDIEIQLIARSYYRDIYVKELNTPEPFRTFSEEQKEGYKVLFDGTNMNEWTGNLLDYTLRNGCIAMDPKQAYGGNLYTKEFSNFIYRFDFKLTPGPTTVSESVLRWRRRCYVGRVQILDCESDHKDITRCSIMVPFMASSLQSLITTIAFKPGRKNGIRKRFTPTATAFVWLSNGQVITEGNIREATKDGTPLIMKNIRVLFNKSGHIAFLAMVHLSSSAISVSRNWKSNTRFIFTLERPGNLSCWPFFFEINVAYPKSVKEMMKFNHFTGENIALKRPQKVVSPVQEAFRSYIR